MCSKYEVEKYAYYVLTHYLVLTYHFVVEVDSFIYVLIYFMSKLILLAELIDKIKVDANEII